MNRNKIFKILSTSLMGIVMVSGSLSAETTEEPKHITVGDRAMSHVERVAVQESRARIAQMIKEGADLTTEEGIQLNEEEQGELANGTTEVSGDKMLSAKMTPKGINATTYYTTHEGAFHHPYSVSLLGDTVELEDGSIWAVCSSDRYKTLDWMTGDLIIITPNDSWFSSYDYKLVNLNTGAKVKVNLALGPIYNGIYTHWIIAIDYYHGEICLEDGSVWKMSSLDSSVVSKWLPNDTIIIGINDGWFSGSNPNLLINVNVNNYAIGKCIY